MCCVDELFKIDKLKIFVPAEMLFEYGFLAEFENICSLSLNFRRNLAENSFCNVDVPCILIGSSSSLGHPPFKWAGVGVSITGGKNYQNSEIEMLDFFFPTCGKVAYWTLMI